MSDNLHILSIDPGYYNLAYSFFIYEKSKLFYIESKVINLSSCSEKVIPYNVFRKKEYIEKFLKVLYDNLPKFARVDVLVMEQQDNKNMIYIQSAITSFYYIYYLKNEKPMKVFLAHPLAVAKFYKLSGLKRENKKIKTQNYIKEIFKFEELSYDECDSIMNIFYFCDNELPKLKKFI